MWLQFWTSGEIGGHLPAVEVLQFNVHHSFLLHLLPFPSRYRDFIKQFSGVWLRERTFQLVQFDIKSFSCWGWIHERIEAAHESRLSLHHYERYLIPSTFPLSSRVIWNKSWGQHPTKQQLYGHLLPITKTIQVRRTRNAGLCWRSWDELIRDVLLWTPSHGRTRAGRPTRTYLLQLCADTGCNPEDLLEAMDDRVREVQGYPCWWRDVMLVIYDIKLSYLIQIICKHLYSFKSYHLIWIFYILKLLLLFNDLLF